MKVTGFNPIFNKESKVLILGSFPSVKSRENSFYYGNKQNRFWKVINNVFNVDLVTNSQKADFLLNNNIALWDIVTECEIDGSLDKDIKNPVFANIKSVLPPNTNVTKILCNGKLSYELTIKHCSENGINIPIVYMPSTSPANVRFNGNQWEEELKKDI